MARDVVPEGWKALAGRIVKVSYLGTHLQIVVRTLGGAEIAAHPRSPSPTEGTGGLEVGDLVRAAWPVAYVLGFPEERGGQDLESRGGSDAHH